MSKLADIFRPKSLESAQPVAPALEQERAGDGVVVAMPLPAARANGAGHAMADAVAGQIVSDDRFPSESETSVEADTPVKSGDGDHAGESDLRRSDESEALHRLLVDTRRKFDDLDALKGTLDEMVLPFRGAMRALDEERTLSARLSRQLKEKTTDNDKLREELQHADVKAERLTAEMDSLRETLDRARDSKRAAESERRLLGEEIKRRDTTIAALEARLEEEAVQRREFGENWRVLQEQALQAERRVSELWDGLAEAERQCGALKQDKRALWRSAEEAREDGERLKRRLAEGEGALSTAQIELVELEARRAEACAERNRLVDTVDQLRAQQRAAEQRVDERIVALEARRAAAERQMSEMRRRLIERTEEARAFVCKAAEATMARATAERRLAALQVAHGVRGGGDDDPTETRTALSEYLRALNLKSREMALASAAEKMALLGERTGQAAPSPPTLRPQSDKQMEKLVAGFEGQGAQPRDIEKTLDAARQADARLAREVADLNGELGVPAAPMRAPAQRGTLGYEAGLVAQLRRADADDGTEHPPG